MKKILLLPSIVAITATPLIGLASCSPTITIYPFEDILSSYKKMLTETIDTEYGQQEASIIMGNIDIDIDIEHFDQPTQIYSFKDIVYTDPDQAIWPAHQHIVRALSIAVAADKETDQAIKEEKFNIATNLILYWLCHEYVNPNWWFNEIGVPRDLSNIALFIWDRITIKQRNMLLEWIHHGSLKYNPNTQSYTGTNTFWAGDITMKSAALVEDREEMDLMFYYVGNEIQLDQEDGFQSDGSYFQHGKQLYSGGYGRQGALILAKIASAFNDTDFRLKEDKLSIIVNFVLDGLKYMTHKGNFTWQCMGRTYVRKKGSNYHPGVTDLGDIREFKYIAKLPNCPRKEELQNLIANWQLEETGQANFEGIRYFPRSQFIACCFDGLYIGVKGTKPELINSEIANNENILAHNLVFGFNTCVMDTGSEYDDISPVWDYSYLPGTTTAVETDGELAYYDNNDFKTRQEGPCYGDYNQEHNVACVAQKGSHSYRDKSSHDITGSIGYRITSFACNGGIVVLGTDIDNKTGQTLHTTVDQYISASTDKDQTAKSLTKDNVVYTNLGKDSNCQLTMSVIKDKQCSWYRNNHSYSQEDMAQANVTTITLSNPVGYTSYAYAIERKDKGISPEVIQNDDAAQAIKFIDNGVEKLACLFWQNKPVKYQGHEYIGNVGELKVWPL